MTSADRPMLAIESSTPTASVALGTGDRLLAEISLTMRGGHSAALLPAIDYAMRATGIERADLGGVVIGGGPGSFTGLRIAAATAKSIARSLELPLFAFSGLLAAAAHFEAADRPVCALFDARGRDVFAACYRFGAGVETILPPSALAVDDLLVRLGGRVRGQGGPARGDLAVEDLLGRLGADGPPLFVGDGALRHRGEIVAAFGEGVAAAHFSSPRAAALLWLAHREPGTGRVAELAAWEPDYLRASGAERIAAANAAAARGS